MEGFDPNKITYFGQTDARGQQVKFGIRAKDRQRHMYVIGKTGMGKSTLLENMAAQDILNGEGMCFMDPHGSAIDTLLEYVPEHRIDDVVYFAPFDMENPISFNMMEDVGPDTRHLVVSGLMSTFKKIWEDAWSARMEYILTNALLALIEYPNTTLLSVNRMLADKEYRDKVVDNIQDPAVKAYWVDEFANYTERFAAEALPAIQNKIGQFTGNPLIRNIIGQPKSSFDVRKLMDEKKILLVNLSKGLVGETNADLLGSMLITRIYLSAMSRAELPAAQMKLMPNFYFYVDEFQSFANSTFANILSEARKYHLNLIIAHQYVEQMEEQIRSAVFGNVGTTISFRVGPFDAEHLEKVFEPKFLANDLINLGPYQIYLSLMIDGAGSTPFSATTLPPVETPPVSYRDMVIARSRANFTKSRAEVQQLVTDLHTPDNRAEASAKGEGGNKGGFSTPKFGVKVGQGQKKGGPGGGGKKDRPKPNFENTILDKLRDQHKDDGKGEKKDVEKKPVPQKGADKQMSSRPDKKPAPKQSREHERAETKNMLAAAVAQAKEQSAQPVPSAPVASKKEEVATANETEVAAVVAKPASEVKPEPKPEASSAPVMSRSERKEPKKPAGFSPDTMSAPAGLEPSTDAPDLMQLRSVLSKISAADKAAGDRGGKKRKRGRNDRGGKGRERRDADAPRERGDQKQAAKGKPAPDLQSALSAALGGAAAQPEPVAPEREEKPVVKTSRPDATLAPAVEPKKSATGSVEQPEVVSTTGSAPQSVQTETAAAQQPVSGFAATEQKTSSDEISPKELERMMRVNAGEKPPIH